MSETGIPPARAERGKDALVCSSGGVSQVPQTGYLKQQECLSHGVGAPSPRPRHEQGRWVPGLSPRLLMAFFTRPSLGERLSPNGPPLPGTPVLSVRAHPDDFILTDVLRKDPVSK